MSAVAIIPARGGSTRIPRKNIRDFMGHPMVAHSIMVAQAHGIEAWVSTEDPEIARVAFKYGAKLHPRSAVMAEDGVGTQEVVRNAILELWPTKHGKYPRPDYVCGIYACAPTLLASDLLAAREALEANHAIDFVMVEGMLYYGRTQAFLDQVPLEGPTTRELEPCYRWVDINVEADWKDAEAIYRRTRSER